MQRKMWIIFALVVLSLASTASVAQVDDQQTNVPPATFNVRPTAYTSGSAPPYLDPPLAYDDNFTTAAIGDVTQANKGANSKIETWDGFPPAPPHASGMQLNVNSSVAAGRGGSVRITYSLGSTGGMFYFVLNGNRSQRTDSIPLSDSQDLTQISVSGQALASSDGTFTSTADSSIFEIWVSGND